MSKILYRGHVRIEPLDRREQNRDRPDPRDTYFPPDEGYPRLRFKSHEVLWLLSRGIPDIDIAKLVGCHRSYPGGVKARYAQFGPSHILKIFSSIPWPSYEFQSVCAGHALQEPEQTQAS